MIPRVAPPSPADAAEASRSVPIRQPASLDAQGVKTPGSEPADKFQPVRVGPLFEVATSEQDVTIAKSDERVELEAYTERLAADRNADQRALQQKLYQQF